MIEPGDKKKALMVYALGISIVLLCVGAVVAHLSLDNCTKKGGEWSWFSCSMPRQGKTIP